MSQLYENLRQLITVVDELRDVGLQHYISLPRIAAIGSQSSGKSSLIETIVGLDFLPRGSALSHEHKDQHSVMLELALCTPVLNPS
eukprot:620652-Amphidinium_carterae.1